MTSASSFFILIHPFREGNGRLSRLLYDVLSVLAGKGLLDYSPMMQLVSDIMPD